MKSTSFLIAPTSDSPNDLTDWPDKELSPQAECLWPFQKLSELLREVQCWRVEECWDKNSRYGNLLQEASTRWIFLGRPSVEWPDERQETEVRPVWVVKGNLRAWLAGGSDFLQYSYLTG